MMIVVLVVIRIFPLTFRHSLPISFHPSVPYVPELKTKGDLVFISADLCGNEGLEGRFKGCQGCQTISISVMI